MDNEKRGMIKEMLKKKGGYGINTLSRKQHSKDIYQKLLRKLSHTINVGNCQHNLDFMKM